LPRTKGCGANDTPAAISGTCRLLEPNVPTVLHRRTSYMDTAGVLVAWSQVLLYRETLCVVRQSVPDKAWRRVLDRSTSAPLTPQLRVAQLSTASHLPTKHVCEDTETCLRMQMAKERDIKRPSSTRSRCSRLQLHAVNPTKSPDFFLLIPAHCVTSHLSPQNLC